jgi:adenine-specific DNA methylase
VKTLRIPQVLIGSATELPYPDNYFDAVLTDPPYYDNVPYADLSDFFYVWLKRTLGDLYPKLFATPLTPKSQEMVADASKSGGMNQAKLRFEEMLTQAFREIRRVLKPNGIAVIVFAHKTAAAWETIINALLEAGLYMTASWPVHTEMGSRLRAHESAALASSIYMVCRKRTSEEVGEYSQVKEELERVLPERLAELWRQGIQGADFSMAAIGPAVEVFGRFQRVERLSGEAVSVGELLDLARRITSEFALRRILKDGHLAGVDNVTQFYLLWRWNYGRALVPFDEARKLALSVGVDLELLSREGLIKKNGSYLRLLGPQDRGFAGKEVPANLIDALQLAALYWGQGKEQELEELLASLPCSLETFWRVAQAIADGLPDGDKERQLLHGLLGRRNGARLREQRLPYDR